MKLKTLKDLDVITLHIDENDEETEFGEEVNGHLIVKQVMINQLKQEAIKWIKEFVNVKLSELKEIVRVIQSHKGNTLKSWVFDVKEFSDVDLCIKADDIEMFVRFFNITEEDLKC